MAALDTPAGRTSLDPMAATLIVVLCLIWGFNQVGVKVANAGIQPVFQAGLRSFFGAILVFAWCRLRGVPLFNADATWKHRQRPLQLFGKQAFFLQAVTQLFESYAQSAGADGIECVDNQLVLTARRVD